MALAMVFPLTGVSFAEETDVVRATNKNSVSVTQDNFDTLGNYIVFDIYLTGVRPEKDMEIIMDLSPFDMSWDTGEPWQ